MILYQALSSYQILECMVHRQVFYKDQKCILNPGNLYPGEDAEILGTGDKGLF